MSFSGNVEKPSVWLHVGYPGYGYEVDVYDLNVISCPTREQKCRNFMPLYMPFDLQTIDNSV